MQKDAAAASGGSGQSGCLATAGGNIANNRF